MEAVGDEAAIYSPLARGASVLSDCWLQEQQGGGGDRTPPRSPW